MERTLIKITSCILAATLFFSCGKKEIKNGHDCCKKATASQQTTNIKIVNEQNSIYQLTGTWTNQQNEQVQLDQLKGKIRLAAMIFTHCGYACPRMVDNMKAIEKQLPAGLKNKVGYVLISFDPERDTPQQLKKYALQKQLDTSWTLLHGNDTQVRLLSMLLQLQYSPLPDGNFNHSNILTILDEQGVIVKQIEGLDFDTKSAARIIEQLAGKQKLQSL
jgi:protein SCO1/2